MEILKCLIGTERGRLEKLRNKQKIDGMTSDKKFDNILMTVGVLIDFLQLDYTVTGVITKFFL